VENQEHLDILKRGIDVWNKWREEYHEKEAKGARRRR
jgi:hypothetical protein